MTREEEIIEASQKCIYTLPATPRSGFRDGAKWADANQPNPWRDAKNDPPKMTDVTSRYKESPAVFVCFDDGSVGVAYYSYSWKRWEFGGSGIPTPDYWMPIPEVPKGGEI